MNVGSMDGFSASFDTRVLIRRLQWIGGTVLPDTVAIALNETADAITERSKANVRRKLTVRTPYTINSIRTKNRARGRDVNRMFARTGTNSKYLPIQNAGGIVRARTRTHAIPTIAARSGQTYGRAVAMRYRLNRMRDWNTDRYFSGVPRGGNRPRGVWERTRNNRRLRLVRRLGHRTIDIPASNWFNDAINAHGRLVGARFRRAAMARLRRM